MGVLSLFNVRRFSICRRYGCLLLVAANIASVPQVYAESFSSVPGVWQMQGYGEILEITSEEVIRYDVTNISCVKVARANTDDADLLYDRLTRSRNKFSLYETGGITRYEFLQLDHLPQRCEFMGDGVVRDPEYNFSVLWHAFALAQKAIRMAGNDTEARRAAQRLMQQAAIR